MDLYRFCIFDMSVQKGLHSEAFRAYRKGIEIFDSLMTLGF